MDFSEKIFNFRAKNNLSQKAVASILGCDQPSVSAYESGKRTPTKLSRARFVAKMEMYEEEQKEG